MVLHSPPWSVPRPLIISSNRNRSIMSPSTQPAETAKAGEALNTNLAAEEAM